MQTWQRPTLPRLETKYHWRWGVSRPCSERERVQPPRDNHQVGKTQQSSCFHMSVVSRSWEACASFNLTRLSLTGPFACLARDRAWQPYRTLVRRASWRGPSGALRASGHKDDVIKLCLMNIFNGNEEVDRAISNGKLHMLPCFHTRPINVVVFHGSDREHSFSGWFPA